MEITYRSLYECVNLPTSFKIHFIRKIISTWYYFFELSRRYLFFVFIRLSFFWLDRMNLIGRDKEGTAASFAPKSARERENRIPNSGTGVHAWFEIQLTWTYFALFG